MKTTVLSGSVLVLLSISVLIGTTISTPPECLPTGYCPWCDFDDDGDIDIFDIVEIAGRYGYNGTAMNKTDLLESLSQLENLTQRIAVLETEFTWLNSTVVSHGDELGDMQNEIGQMNTTITMLQDELSILNASHTNLESTISVLQQMVDLLADRVATLEAYQVNSTGSSTVHSITEEHVYLDMNDMSVTLNLQHTSHVLIFFTTEAQMTAGNGSIRVMCRANQLIAEPGSIDLTPSLSQELCPSCDHRHSLDASAYSFNFYIPSLPAGNYTIKIQWRLFSLDDGVEASVTERTLTALAFPTE
ncbi:MAG: hypothetical protein JSV35_07975 [Candidatus Bathyarchaeota archaeon]|nr:MAG: hypothetical protein JSV35_07975 [Candidatus Bathyarchaeota archaeon]